MEQEQEQPTKRSRAAAANINAYRRLFATEDGKLVLENLMKISGISNTIIGRDVYETYFNEGRRSIVLQLIGTVNMKPAQVEQMIVSMNTKQDDGI